MTAAAALILAGGRATRLGGRTKPLVEVEGQTILTRQLAVLAPLCSPIAISVAAPGDLAALGAGPGLVEVVDRLAGAGPLAGLAAGLAWCPTARLVVVAGDLPFLSAALLRRLVAEDGELVVPHGERGLEPLCAVYARTLAPLVDRRLGAGQLALQDLLPAARAAGHHVRELDLAELRMIDPALRCFTNVNRPDDLP